MILDRLEITPYRPVGKLIQLVLISLLLVGIEPGKTCVAAQKPEAASPVKLLLLEQVTTLEEEIASLIQSRPDTTGDASQSLELRIDLRVCARAMFALAVDAKGESDVQISATLRGQSLLSAVGLFEQLLAQSPQTKLTSAQLSVAKEINKLTYKLGEAVTVAQLDECCKGLGVNLARLAGAQSVPTMRPVPVVPKETNQPRDPKPDKLTRTAQQLEAEARQVSVSVPLRRQLLALARLATIVPGDEGAAITRILTDSVDMAAGLSANRAVDPETRNKIEFQLAEAIALYSDSRTRSAGQKRLDDLKEYRQLLGRVGRLQLPPETLNTLGPAFAYARQNQDKGKTVLSAIESFSDSVRRFGRIQKSPDLPPSYQKSFDALGKNFAQLQNQFVTDAGDLGNNTIMNGGPADLAKSADSLKRAVDVSELLNRLPGIVQNLLPYRPRQANLIQKRVESTLSVAQADTPAADDAATSLKQLDQLSGLADRLSAKLSVDPTSDFVSKYTGGKWSEFDAHCKSLVGDVLGDFAVGGKFLPDKLHRLDTACALREALELSLSAEVAIRQADILRRWTDWTISTDRLRGIVQPYQEVLGEAFAGFIADRQDPIDRWQRAIPRYFALLNLLKESADYLPACGAFPTGLAGEAGRLQTGFDNQPYERYRYASFMLMLWSGFEQRGETDNADATAGRLAKRLGK